MTGDFSRNSQDPTKSYTGVLMQQGRVQVDADWNEQLALAQYRTDTETVDVIGESGTPMGEDGFGISLTPSKDDFFIHPGRYYVGGLLCEIDPEWVAVSIESYTPTKLSKLLIPGGGALTSSWLDGRPIVVNDWFEIKTDSGSDKLYSQLVEIGWDGVLHLEPSLKTLTGKGPLRLRRAITYLTQPFYPSPDFAPGVSSPPLETSGLSLILDGGDYVVYLEAWQRSANALEDPHIREVALDGPDTAERIQTVWQVRLLPVTDAEGKNLCQAHLSEWNSLLAKNATTAQMNAHTAPPLQTTNKCMLPPSAGFQGLQNQLYRIEILHGGSESEATFIWSRDNGMVETSIVSVNSTPPNNTVTVTSLGTDDLHSFAIGDWVEIVDRDDELDGTHRFFAQIVKPAPDPAGKQITLSASVPQPYLDGINNPPIPSTNFYRLKRWDMPTAGVTEPGIQIIPNTWMKIEEGVEVWFNDGHYAERAWWLIPARTSTADIDWPPFQVPNTEPIPQPPLGIRRNFCRIGTINSELTPWKLGDCRHFFPPLTALEGLYYVGGDGQEAMPGQPLPEPLQVRVANGGWPVKGVEVQFKFDQANSGLFTSGTADPDFSTAITVTTDKDGIAQCTWTLPGNWKPVKPTVPPSVAPPAYKVIATVVDPALQDSGGNSIYMPVVFSAEWSTADQVAFAPSGCVTLGSCTTVQEALETLCPPALYYVGGDGQDARPGKQLPLALQVSVATGASAVASASKLVTFTVVFPSAALLSDTQGVAGSSGPIQIGTDSSGIASCYWTPDNLTPNQQVKATLNGSTASPVYFNVNYDPGVHITNIQYRKTPYGGAASLVNLNNNEVIPAYYFANDAELSVACDGSLNGATITRGSCYLTLDWFYQYQFYAEFNAAGGRGGAILPGTFLPLIVDAGLTLSSDKKNILWQPTGPAQQMIYQIASAISALSYPPRVLARLAIKGNMILSDAAKPLHLDGEAFFDAAGVMPDGMSGDGRRGGTYEMYFWLTWNILLTFPNGLQASPADPVLAPWAANTKYAVNEIVIDPHGNLEEVSVAGTSGATAPPWPATFTDGTTVDGQTGLTWQQTSPGYSMSFGQSSVKVTQTILVTNVSSAAVKIGTELVFGSTKIWGLPEPIIVNAGENSALVITWTPAIGATGAGANGIMVITTSDPSAPSVTVGLSGTPATTQAMPALGISPSTLTFGSQAVGTTSAAKTITLTAETAAVTVNSVEIFGPTSADFSFQTGCTSIAVNAKCVINVTFTPSQAGQRAGLLIINDNAGGTPQTVMLLGTGS